jgi:hypothetical protein
MKTKPPASMTPADCDLRDFGFMPLEIERLRRSRAWIFAKRQPELGFYMLNLWAAAFHERPAASVENDDDILAALAECDPSRWPDVREKVLRGWVECSDGRLYHPVVAEKALEAWIEKLGQRKSSGAGNAKRWGVEFDPAGIDRQITEAAQMLAALNPQSRTLQKKTARTATGTPKASQSDPTGIPSGSQGTGTGTGTGKNTLLRNDADASEPKKAQNGTQPHSKPVANDKDWLWRDGLNWLSKATGKPEKSLRSQIGRWLKDTKENPTLLREIFEAAQAENVFDPVPWIVKAIKTRMNAAAPFEATDDYGWRKRFASFKEHGTWPPQWGGKFPGDDKRHPQRILEEFGLERAA